ncbi:MAG: hypothetical protein WCD56_21360 [Pseudolabrys sp.]
MAVYLGAFMNLKLVVVILAIAAVPVCAQAQKPSAAMVTKADAQKVVKIISGNKAKAQTYSDINNSVSRSRQPTRKKTAKRLMSYLEK